MKLLFIAYTISLLFYCTVNQELTSGKDLLLERLTSINKIGYMFGHQDDTFYGLNWEWELDRSDIYETVGDYPAIMGFDLGGIELGDDKNLDDVPFYRIREELIKHHQRGGIVTISWHPRNPVTGGSAWDTSDKSTVNKILTNESVKNKFLGWINLIADFSQL